MNPNINLTIETIHAPSTTPPKPTSIIIFLAGSTPPSPTATSKDSSNPIRISSLSSSRRDHHQQLPPPPPPTWRDTLSTHLAHYFLPKPQPQPHPDTTNTNTTPQTIHLTILDPFRPDWDSSWREDPSFPPFKEQVSWEMEQRERADIVLFYFDPGTMAPVSLLELGLSMREPGKLVVVCPRGYWKSGFVRLACERFGVQVVEGLEEGAGVVGGLVWSLVEGVRREGC
ncbi:nucleoside 2-deoxyribosyltransferase domain-containing protein [Aspergillus vadensis CBS 113365]|uniref:Uncharacterized protein n=1 Tax=Aspergillus vadensis (strain CBS 113365 / IMI 142717 / IBT 24658) TaxID=1448311 RepID=A0A319C8L6_ASPVC|nr:hypothetical protein BO88DRAFT_451372 [Aspergillus vadensis CBS 113365]PYH71688.1 hypothetical protein BO88DRAFT_451372 [Aspergillus vadensis CBS 113365]